MKRKWLIALMGGLVLVGVVGSGALASQRVDVKFNGKRFRAYVYPERGRHEIRMTPHRKSQMEAAGVLSDLDLTTEQQKEVDRLQVAFQRNILELRLQLEEKELGLRRLLLKDSPAQEEIEALVDEMGTVWAEIQKENINFRMRLEDILTQEQLVKLGGRQGARFRADIMRKNRFFSHFR